jgi:Tol biopolymer transport system component
MPVHGDVLAIAGSLQSPFVYFELTGQHSQIFRLPAEQLGNPDAIPEYVAEGYDPAISYDGRWLAYLREEYGKTTIWMVGNALSPTASSRGSSSGVESFKALPVAVAVPGSQNLDGVLEMSITPSGDVIASAGSAADPHLALLHAVSGEVHGFAEIRGAVRYPAISADGKRLAFSRRESGAWHLFVREMETGREQQLTSAACNATSPSWQDAQTLLYLSDCGRGLGLAAPARVTVP